MSRPVNMSKPLHIVYVLHSLGRGGMENGVVNILNRADPARFRFTVVLLEKERAMLERVERPGVDVITIRRRWGNDPLFPAGIYNLCRRAEPDLVHTRGFSAIEGLAAARLAGVKAVMHSEHGRDVDEAHRMKPRRAWARTILYKFADRVVTVSEELRASLLAEVRVPAAKVTCLPNGVDLARFDRRFSREHMRYELGIPQDARVIGTVGRHDPVKDYPSLLRAFASVQEQSRRAWLVLCGDGPEGPRLRTMAQDLGIADRTVFTGFRDDVPDVLSAFDVFCLPSVTEGMSNAILEAMASRLPCVATRVGGNGELVTHGVTGLLVPTQNAERLAESLTYLVSDEDVCAQMARASRARAEARFSLDGMVRNYEDLYETLVHGAPTRRPVVVPATPVAVPVAPTPVHERATALA
jgi:sugar transferase (PEP-CTERM/EpsH1 system associated)